jgi:hypothetical protein
MSKRDRRDIDGRDRDRRDGDRRDGQWEDEQQRRSGEGEIQEGDSVTALKAILSKVAAQLRPLNLTAEEAIGLVEQLYGSMLDVDLALAGEADDTRKSSTFAYLHNTRIRRDGDRLVVEFPTAEELRAAEVAGPEAAGEASAEAGAGQAAAGETSDREFGGAQPPRGARPRQPQPRPGRGPQAPRVDPPERAAADPDPAERVAAEPGPAERSEPIERLGTEAPEA